MPRRDDDEDDCWRDRDVVFDRPNMTTDPLGMCVVNASALFNPIDSGVFVLC